MQAIAPYSIFGHTITPGEVLIASAVLLAISALMLISSRRRSITLRRSLVTDELMIHLSRIGDMLERQAMRQIDTVISESQKRVEDPPPPKRGDQSHSSPYSIFGH